MSKQKHSDPLIKNEETLRRRAWVEQALAGVRLRSGPDICPSDSPEPPEKPRLYVVGSGPDSQV